MTGATAGGSLRTCSTNRVLVLEGGTLIDGTGKPPVAYAVLVTSGGLDRAGH